MQRIIIKHRKHLVGFTIRRKLTKKELIIKRVKSFPGCAVVMNLYVNDRFICNLENGESFTCTVDTNNIQFKCNLLTDPISDIYCFDIEGNKNYIYIKQGVRKPNITIFDNKGVEVVPKISTSRKVESSQCTNPTVFVPTSSEGSYFGINEKTRQWAVGNGLISTFKNSIPYSYDDIIDFELIEDGTCITKGGLGQATIGGALFGGVGAIVGGITGTKKSHYKCTSLMVKITVNDMSTPVKCIKLINTSIDKNSLHYKSSFESAQKIISMLQIICNQRNVESIKNDNLSIETSSADEIRKFKQLLDDDIITEDEFLAKKKQLLRL